MPSSDMALRETAAHFLEAWNSQDAEAVLACYGEDLIYRDPNTRGEVQGSEAMRRYLTKLFSRWTMRWSLREAFALEGVAGGAILWRASFVRRDGTQAVEADGMDLVLMRGDRIVRNEVYFDRLLLSPLSGRANSCETARWSVGYVATSLSDSGSWGRPSNSNTMNPTRARQTAG